MPSYRVRIVGTDFDAEDDGSDYVDTKTAARAAVKAAIDLAAEEVSAGKSGAVLEARVEDGDHVIARYVVALSVEALEPKRYN